MSLEEIKVAELIMLRFVIGSVDLLNTEELDQLHYIEDSARQGSLEKNLVDELTAMYNRIRELTKTKEESINE